MDAGRSWADAATRRVLVLTTYDTDSYVLPAIEAGATGYLLKDAPRDELLRAVHIYAKLGVTDRAAAVAEAFNRGLLTPVKPERG